jgi:hypothetical protein
MSSSNNSTTMVLMIGLLLFFCVSSCTVVFSASAGLAVWYVSGKDDDTLKTTNDPSGNNPTQTPTSNTPTQTPGPSETPPAAGDITYKLYSKGYSPGGDLVKIESSNLETLRKECNDRGDKCVAFTSDGWLKGSLVSNFSVPYSVPNNTDATYSNLPGIYVKRVSTAADKSSLAWKTRKTVTDASSNLVYSYPKASAVCRVKLTNGDDFVGMGSEVVDPATNTLTNDFVYAEPAAAAGGTPQVTTITDTSKYECLVYSQEDGKNVKRPYWSSDPNIPATKRYKCGTMKENGQDKAIYACRAYYTSTTTNKSIPVTGYWKEGGDACVVVVKDGNSTTVNTAQGTGLEFLVYD